MRRAIQASLNNGFFTPLPSCGSALERNPIELNRDCALGFYFVAFASREPVLTSLENARTKRLGIRNLTASVSIRDRTPSTKETIEASGRIKWFSTSRVSKRCRRPQRGGWQPLEGHGRSRCRSGQGRDPPPRSRWPLGLRPVRQSRHARCGGQTRCAAPAHAV